MSQDRPPAGIKKEDRLGLLLCPIVNRKMFIKKEHENLVDEMFEFQKLEMMTLTDLVCCHYSKPPKSSAIDIDKLNDKTSKIEESRLKES